MTEHRRGLRDGSLTVWDAGSRLVFTYRDAGHEIDGTEVGVCFQPVPIGTRMTLDHREWDWVGPAILAGKLNTKC